MESLQELRGTLALVAIPQRSDIISDRTLQIRSAQTLDHDRITGVRITKGDFRMVAVCRGVKIDAAGVHAAEGVLRCVLHVIGK